MQPSVEVIRQEGFESSSWSCDELFPHASEASEDSSERSFHRGSWERGRASGERIVVDFRKEGEGSCRKSVEDVDTASCGKRREGRRHEGEVSSSATRLLLLVKGRQRVEEENGLLTGHDLKLPVGIIRVH